MLVSLVEAGDNYSYVLAKDKYVITYFVFE